MQCNSSVKTEHMKTRGGCGTFPPLPTLPSPAGETHESLHSQGDSLLAAEAYPLHIVAGVRKVAARPLLVFLQRSTSGLLLLGLLQQSPPADSKGPERALNSPAEKHHPHEPGTVGSSPFVQHNGRELGIIPDCCWQALFAGGSCIPPSPREARRQPQPWPTSRSGSSGLQGYLSRSWLNQVLTAQSTRITREIPSKRQMLLTTKPSDSKRNLQVQQMQLTIRQPA